jgi:hypothetical protein
LAEGLKNKLDFFSSVGFWTDSRCIGRLLPVIGTYPEFGAILCGSSFVRAMGTTGPRRSVSASAADAGQCIDVRNTPAEVGEGSIPAYALALCTRAPEQNYLNPMLLDPADTGHKGLATQASVKHRAIHHSHSPASAGPQKEVVRHQMLDVSKRKSGASTPGLQSAALARA